MNWAALLDAIGADSVAYLVVDGHIMSIRLGDYARQATHIPGGAVLTLDPERAAHTAAVQRARIEARS